MMNPEPHGAESASLAMGSDSSSHQRIVGTGLVLCAGQWVIAFRSWRDARTNEARADLWGQLIRQRAEDAGVDFLPFARDWLDRYGKPSSGQFAMVHPVYRDILIHRFFNNSPAGQAAACLTQSQVAE